MPTSTQVIAAGKVLDDAGVPYRVDRHRKHMRLTWTIEGKEYALFCCRTPSDWRGDANCRATVRRMLRAAGVAV